MYKASFMGGWNNHTVELKRMCEQKRWQSCKIEKREVEWKSSTPFYSPTRMTKRISVFLKEAVAGKRSPQSKPPPDNGGKNIFVELELDRKMEKQCYGCSERQDP